MDGQGEIDLIVDIDFEPLLLIRAQDKSPNTMDNDQSLDILEFGSWPPSPTQNLEFRSIAVELYCLP